MGRKKAIVGLLTLALLASPMFFASAEPDSSVRAEDLKKLSIQEITSRAESAVSGMQRMLKDSFNLLEKSIQEKRPEEVTMRREAITAMKGLVRLSEDGLMALRQYVAEGDRERVQHEYVKIVIASSKIGELYAQVQSVGGVFDLEVADVERKLTYVGSLPADPVIPTQFQEVSVMPEPPVSASPYF